MIRKTLDCLYSFCGVLACISLFATAAIILAQIIGRMLGILIPSSDEFAGFAMGAATFLGLAYTLRADGHIRVNLFTQKLSPSVRRPVEICVLIIGVAVMSYFTWYNASLTYSSYEFNDVSAGLIPVALWIPQSVMTFGTLLMTVALLDELILTIRGRPTTYSQVDNNILQAE
ncbi:TRAP transporter small permease [Alcaligenaceae bacterium]|nr:TRAP transporter small permease [Alcaligenaceae bacterium]